MPQSACIQKQISVGQLDFVKGNFLTVDFDRGLFKGIYLTQQIGGILRMIRIPLTLAVQSTEHNRNGNQIFLTGLLRMCFGVVIEVVDHHTDGFNIGVGSLIEGLVAVSTVVVQLDGAGRSLKVDHTAIFGSYLSANGLTVDGNSPCAGLQTCHIDLEGLITFVFRNDEGNILADAVVAVHIEHSNMVHQLSAHQNALAVIDQLGRNDLCTAVCIADIHNIQQIVGLVNFLGSGGNLHTTPALLLTQIAGDAVGMGIIVITDHKFPAGTTNGCDGIILIRLGSSTHIQHLIGQLAVVIILGILDDDHIAIDFRLGLHMQQEALLGAHLAGFDLVKDDKRTGIFVIAIQLQIQEKHTSDCFLNIGIIRTGNITCEIGILGLIHIGSEFLADYGVHRILLAHMAPVSNITVDLLAVAIGDGGNGQRIVCRGGFVIIRIVLGIIKHIITGFTGQNALVIDLERTCIVMLVVVQIYGRQLHLHDHIVGSSTHIPAGTGDHRCRRHGEITGIRQIVVAFRLHIRIVVDQTADHTLTGKCHTTAQFVSQPTVMSVFIQIGQAPNCTRTGIPNGILIGLIFFPDIAFTEKLTVRTHGIQMLVTDHTGYGIQRINTVFLAIAIIIIVTAGHLIDQVLCHHITVCTTSHTVAGTLMVGTGYIPDISRRHKHLEVSTANVFVEGGIFIVHRNGDGHPVGLDQVTGQMADHCRTDLHGPTGFGCSADLLDLGCNILLVFISQQIVTPVVDLRSTVLEVTAGVDVIVSGELNGIHCTLDGSDCSFAVI